MSITADIYYPSPHAKIIGALKCQQFKDFRTLEFLVDTGSTITTILPFHADALGINWESLRISPTPCNTATGEPTYPRILPKVELRLDRNNGEENSYINFYLPLVYVIVATPDHPLDDEDNPPAMVSLLGMDVLRKFPNWRWDIDRGYLYLNP